MAFQIGKNCHIHPGAVINVHEGFLGDGSLIREGARIEGHRVELGRDTYLDRGAMIGGGSAFDPDAFLVCGDFLHMGWNSQINIACGVTIGHEFGCGIETKIFTHGAHLDSYGIGAPVQWAPVTIGNNVWMPNAWVNPGVTIGDRVLVAARSLVNRDIPSGAFAAGVPARVVKENYLPRAMDAAEKRRHLEDIVRRAWARQRMRDGGPLEPEVRYEGETLILPGEVRFDVAARTIEGPVTPWSRVLNDQLRRNGIRFRYCDALGVWTAWKQSRHEI